MARPKKQAKYNIGIFVQIWRMKMTMRIANECIEKMCKSANQSEFVRSLCIDATLRCIWHYSLALIKIKIIWHLSKSNPEKGCSCQNMEVLIMMMTMMVMMVMMVMTALAQIPISTFSHIWVFVRQYGVMFVIIVIIIIIIIIYRKVKVSTLKHV